MKRFLTLAVLVCIGTVALTAQDNTELLNRLQALEQRIQELEAEVAELKGASAEAAPAPAPAPAAPAPEVVATPPAVASTTGSSLPNYGGSAASMSKIFNPDISVIGDFLGTVGNGGPRPTPSLQLHEAELGLQAIVDPYARADFFISFGEQGVDLEEGYLTFAALPGELQLKAGKMRAAFGKVNTLHVHNMPWIDRPLVTQNLVGDEEGISDAGLSVSRILPAPQWLFLEGTAQVFRGDSEGVFQSYRPSDVSVVGHLRGYHDLSDSTNIDLGASYARGHSPDGQNLINQLYGVDATLRWKPLRRSIYHSFIGRSEFIWNKAQVPGASPTSFGFYASGEYQLGRRWFAAARFDRSGRMGDPNARDTAGSLLLTYWPSEFSQIRGQVRRTSYAERITTNELFLQLVFSIGAHGAHPF